MRTRSRRRYLLCAFVAAGIGIFVPMIWDMSQYEQLMRASFALFAFFFAMYAWRCMLEAMHLSMYAKMRDEGNDYWKAYVEHYGIFTLPFAKEAFMRLGIPLQAVRRDELHLSGQEFASCMTSVYAHNQEFRAFLESRGVTKDHWTGVWSWMERREREIMNNAYIFDKEHRKHMHSLGETFSYGQTFALSEYGRHVQGISVSASWEHFYARAFSLLAQALGKSAGANAVIVSSSVDDAREYVYAFVPHLEGKKWIELNTDAVIALRQPEAFEHVLRKVLLEAASAGNVVLVIPHITDLLSAAHVIGSDAELIMSEYMRHPDLHIVMLVDRASFHSTLETSVSLMQAAEKIELDEVAPEMLGNIAEQEVIAVERRYGILFSYQALQFIVESVIRYGSERMHDALKDYLDEIAVHNRKHRKKNRFITENIAKSYIAEKTGIQGTFADVSDTHHSIDIRTVLSKRVKGQDEAIAAVAEAMERMRAGLTSSKRPLGTFLFLGPTGVGKTETAKALAYAYFGNEEKMLRLDMNEFSSGGSVAQLIGSFETGESGVLTSGVRDAGHGVILFDEIEKAHEKVKDLLLQMLDEGYITDARGNRANAKNFIIIATSNAGSDEIYVAHASGHAVEKNVLVQHIIEKGIFKPEFLNRFDEIAVFKPLGERQLAAIASLMLQAYADELYKKKAIRLRQTPELVEYIIGNIDNKTFGGREIRRVIQHAIEGSVAKDILQGKARAGNTLAFAYNKAENRLIASYGA